MVKKRNNVEYVKSTKKIKQHTYRNKNNYEKNILFLKMINKLWITA